MRTPPLKLCLYYSDKQMLSILGVAIAEIGSSYLKRKKMKIWRTKPSKDQEWDRFGCLNWRPSLVQLLIQEAVIKNDIHKWLWIVMALSNFKYIGEVTWWPQFESKVHTWATNHLWLRVQRYMVRTCQCIRPVLKAGKMLKSWKMCQF